MTAKPTPLDQAAAVYISRADNKTHPAGSMINGTWHPGPTEKRPCCDSITAPTAEYPFSLRRHCRSLQHTAALFGVDEKDLRAHVKRIRDSRDKRKIAIADLEEL